MKLHKLLMQNLNDQFSDDISSLCGASIYNEDKITIMFYSKHFHISSHTLSVIIALVVFVNCCSQLCPVGL